MGKFILSQGAVIGTATSFPFQSLHATRKSPIIVTQVRLAIVFFMSGCATKSCEPRAYGLFVLVTRVFVLVVVVFVPVFVFVVVVRVTLVLLVTNVDVRAW